MDDPGPPKSSLNDSTKTTIGVLVALAVVLVVAGIGIATVRDASDTVRKATATTTSTVPAPANAPPAAAGDLTPEQSEVVEEMRREVAAIRGLEWKGTLSITFLTKEQLAQRVRDLTAKENAEHQAELTTYESVLKLLKLIGKDVDFVKAFDAIFTASVLAFYEDEAKELVVGGTASGTLDAATKATLAHELTHALTDQHFDTGVRMKALDDENRSEEAVALRALAEGDAELTAGLWQERHLSDREQREAALGGSVDADVYARAPQYLLESLFFPYQDGLTFVRSRHRAGGFAEVDNAYRNPPTSTEHILHPETYASGQTWAPPPLPDLAAATGCGHVDSGSLGEFDMAQILAREIRTTDAQNAAEGWNGDAFAVVRCGAALGLADRWLTDDPADAGQLADALSRWARGWSGASRGPDAEGRFTGPSGSGRVVRNGGRIDLVLAEDAATADRLAGVLLAG